ncbi:MAG TPA: 2-amino-4-hydroxy-6-hydroxymethyldihydropteridine diphosphokinase [Chthoniobacterales bacterium]|nr:2-amino-4-hydroxy-6-hydroxymethyldihydropteridine diphosphokinase [Chthoniobacterales bacterium]
MRAGIALGANLGDRLRNLTTARDQIFAFPKAAAPFLSSAVYETEPVECEPEAAKFLNAVVEVGYTGSSRQLLEALQEIEAALGRPPSHPRHHSRTIDLDLLYHGARQLDEPQLQLPHPRMKLRGFVLHPLAEIRPNLVLPGEIRTIGELSAELAHAPSVVRSPLQW